MSYKFIDWRKSLQWAFLLAVIGGLAYSAQAGYSSYLRSKARKSQSAKLVPFTVVLRETVRGLDGTTREASDTTWAFRSDGSSARRILHKHKQVDGAGGSDGVSSPDQNFDSERKILLASGAQIVIDEITNAKSTTFAKNVNPAKWQRDPASKCINSLAGTPMISGSEIVSGEETVAGYKTVKIIAGNVTRWLAPDYGCATIKSRMDFSPGEYSEHNVVALIPGEPDPALFHVSKDAKELSPSQRILISGKDCTKCGPRFADTLRRLDEDYYKRRAVNDVR